VSAVVAVDGFIRRVFPPQPAPDTAPRWLDLQRSDRVARAETAERLADGRQTLNPRVERAWIEHLVATGTRPAATDDGLRSWKIDPAAFPLPPHGMTTEACLQRMAAVRCPLLALVAGVPESIAGQPTADELRPYLPAAGRLEVLDGLGHFAHIEAPHDVAGRVLAFLAASVPDAPDAA